MKRQFMVLCSLVLMSLVAGGATGDANAADAPAVTASAGMTPDDMYALFARYTREQDVEKIGTLFDENALFIPGNGEETVRGRENIKKVFEAYVASLGSIEIISRSIHLNGDLALVNASWRLKTQTGYFGGKASEVLKRTADGKWVFIIDNPYGE